MNEYDALIIGGGLSGSALANWLARKNWNVALIEKDRFPRDKLCGEFLSPEAQDFLIELGVMDKLKQQGISYIKQARFTHPSGKEIRFDLPGIGLGVKRSLLDATLFASAQKAGAHALEGVRIDRLETSNQSITAKAKIDSTIQRWKAPLAIACYGRRTALDAKLNRPYLQKKHNFVGFKRHLQLTNQDNRLNNTVEIHTFSGGYCGCCFVDQNTVNVCMLIHQNCIQQITPFSWERLVEWLKQQNPCLKERMLSLQPLASPMLSVGQVPFAYKEKCIERVLFCGDSAGMISPLCGDGQAMALASAYELSKLLEEWKCSNQCIDILQNEWQTRWRNQFQQAIRIGNWLQYLMLSPTLTRPIIHFSQQFPALPTWITHITRSPVTTAK